MMKKTVNHDLKKIIVSYDKISLFSDQNIFIKKFI